MKKDDEHYNKKSLRRQAAEELVTIFFEKGQDLFPNNLSRNKGWLDKNFPHLIKMIEESHEASKEIIELISFVIFVKEKHRKQFKDYIDQITIIDRYEQLRYSEKKGFEDSIYEISKSMNISDEKIKTTLRRYRIKQRSGHAYKDDVNSLEKRMKKLESENNSAA